MEINDTSNVTLSSRQVRYILGYLHDMRLLHPTHQTKVLLCFQYSLPFRQGPRLRADDLYILSLAQEQLMSKYAEEHTSPSL